MEPTAIISELTEALRETAAAAQNETELRLAFEPKLKDAIEASGWSVNWSARHEKTLAGGFADSVFGQAVIEYKSPQRSLRTASTPTAREAREELERYLSAEEPDEAARVRMVGIATNGHHIFFLRWHDRPDEPWELEGPVEVSENAVAHMLHYLRAVARKRLSPEALADDFGPRSVAARAVVNALLEAFGGAEDPKVATMFDEWDRIFGIVYGQDLRKALKDAQQLAEAYQVEAEADLKPLLFCVHTYFALFIKLLTAELMSQRDPMMPSFIGGLAAGSPEALRGKLADLEEGGIFAQVGITNFLEGDFFGWFLSVYGERLDRALRTMLRAMQSYEPATPSFLPEETRDLLKRLYQYLVPKKLRHDLGEYYTPDWLAELVLNEVGYEGDPEERVLDPACGSGTFLVLAIRRIRERMRKELLEPGETLHKILDNVVGFDLNPLAVIAARANYLLALGDLINYRRGPIRLPVYLCDSILTPSREQEEARGVRRLPGEGLRLRTVVGAFDIPEAVVEEGRLEELTGCLERCVRDGYSVAEFLTRAEREVGLSEEGFAAARRMLDGLYRKLVGLQAEGRNRIWARLIKNAFAPLFQPKFDYVVGNPPWVNWEHLSEDYRQATAGLWREYGFFTQEGYRALVPAGKLDLATLFTNLAAHEYLKHRGRLGFVITQTVFKSIGAEGFRRFVLPGEVPMKVLGIIDLVDLKPFEGATNRTATLVLQKGSLTEYPLPYEVWRRVGAGRPDTQDPLDLVLQGVTRTHLHALPISADRSSPLMTGPLSAIQAVRGVTGPSAYAARAGVYTRGANGIYWCETVEELPDGGILIRNLHDTGRKKFQEVAHAVEADLLYPLLRGRDVRRWQAAPSALILAPHDAEHAKNGLPEPELRHDYPETYAYFARFREELLGRSMFEKIGGSKAFYGLFEIGSYTFAPHKVVWRDMGEGMATAVVGSVEEADLGTKIVVPEHHVMLVPFEEPVQAHYLCATLNSGPADVVVRGYTVSTQISTHVLEHVAVPKFEAENEVHRRLAELSMRAHELAAQGESGAEELAEVEDKVDRAAAELWGITDQELAAIKETLEELG